MNPMNRRSFLRTAAASAASAALATARPSQAATASPSRAPSRPNIVIILADDMGYSDIGCYGGEIATPNIDRLAENGLRFTQFYNPARCCPTRASLLTGLYPHQAGMGRMVSFGDAEEGPYQGYLNRQCVTLAEALRPVGYKSYMAGKWHVGELPEHWPHTRGFDRYFGLISGASSYFELLENPQRPRRMALDDQPWTPPEEGFYMTDAFTDFAVECIEQHEEPDPYFLYVPYTAPHWPLHAHPEDIDKYRDRYHGGWDALRAERYEKMLALGIIRPEWPLSPRDSQVPAWEDVEDKERWALLMAVYAAMMDSMDQGIGRILDALEAKGELDNTLVFFLSDNGGCHETVERRGLDQPGTQPGERGSYVAYDRPWANASNTPFRLFKHWVHEGGAATPCVAHWPEGIAARGALTEAVGHVIDFMPTCLELAGAAYPAAFGEQPIVPVEGESLVPVLRGDAEGAPRTPNPRTLYWEHMGNRAIRKGDWKLVTHKDSDDWELYNLVDDRTELNDRSGTEAERVEHLLADWQQWAERIGV